jgi:hypothetical protein
MVSLITSVEARLVVIEQEFHALRRITEPLGQHGSNIR